MARKSKCKLINDVCPENGDPRNGDYCPKWYERGIPWEEKDESGNVVQTFVHHCTDRSVAPALLDAVKSAKSAAASAESNRNEVVQGLTQLTQAVEFMPKIAYQDD